MTDKPDIERLLALAEAATEGPWRPGLASDPEWICDPEGFFIAMVSPDDDDPRPNCQTKEGIEANVAFIAAARTALPEVCTYALGLEARVKELEAGLRHQKQTSELANMFWDAEDPEQPYYSVEDLLHERDYTCEPEGIVEAQRAINLPNTAYRFRVDRDPDSDDCEVHIDELSDLELMQYRACRSVAYALRRMFDALAKAKAAELFAAEEPDKAFNRQPLYVRKGYELRAAALLANPDPETAA